MRTVRGTVVDKDETPVDTAVVYLKNVHTQDIITHLSGSDGTFRFSGLDLNLDYEIHAEKDGWTSSTRSISNFDTRKEFVAHLEDGSQEKLEIGWFSGQPLQAVRFWQCFRFRGCRHDSTTRPPVAAELFSEAPLSPFSEYPPARFAVTCLQAEAGMDPLSNPWT